MMAGLSLNMCVESTYIASFSFYSRQSRTTTSIMFNSFVYSPDCLLLDPLGDKWYWIWAKWIVYWWYPSIFIVSTLIHVFSFFFPIQWSRSNKKIWVESQIWWIKWKPNSWNHEDGSHKGNMLCYPWVALSIRWRFYFNVYSVSQKYSLIVTFQASHITVSNSNYC